jgi:uncharacterized circularly permuted ATP-grasp superfamily protein
MTSLKSMRAIYLAVLSVWLCTPATAQKGANAEANANAYYNEVFGEDGSVRPIYAEAYAIYKNLSEKARKDFLKKTYEDFRGDNTLHYLPRLMSESEIDMLRRGVKQRGEALLMFLQDHYSGRKTYEKAGIFPVGFMDRMLRRSGEQYFTGKLSPDNMGFKYGPDIIRDKAGNFPVLEDNINAVGGDGDLPLARESLFKRIPEYEQVLEIKSNPDEFYSELVKRFRKLAAPRTGAIVYYSESISELADWEVTRTREIFRKLGVITVSPHSDARLVVEAGKTYVTLPTDGGVEKQPVGFLAIDGEPYEFDFSHPFCREKVLFANAQRSIAFLEQIDADPKDLKGDALTNYKWLQKAGVKKVHDLIEQTRQALIPNDAGVINYDRILALLESNELLQFDFSAEAAKRPRGVFELIMNGSLPSNVGLGAEFVGDKEFYMYVDDIIRHYKKEEPILKNLETESFAKYDQKGKAQLSRATLEKFTSNPKDYVVKGVGGRGGDEVWIGAKMTAAKIKQVVAKIEADPSNFIIQPNTHLSVLGDLIVDSRFHTWVGKGGAIVSPVPWGRGIPISGDGKVNLSAQGREVTIIPVVDRVRNDCMRMARKAL